MSFSGDKLIMFLAEADKYPVVFLLCLFLFAFPSFQTKQQRGS